MAKYIVLSSLKEGLVPELPPDGTYEGRWGENEAIIEVNGTEYTLVTELGLKSHHKKPVEVVVDEGLITIKT